ncbi:MAG: zf-HC2 domain-containing protein [Planctomycetes bacterium]|nr:zf-HC2 domain-containing protein [Planctomycetota bacterium]MBI3845403.1 zf-HC2 domain-containing protein [Planctomycetota bacterium]
MKCSDFIRDVGPYLDSELDPKTALEMARHAETCAACAARLEGERRLEASLARRLAAGAPTPELWDAAIRRVDRGRPTRRAWRWIAAAAVLAVVAGAAFVVWPRHHEMDLADVAYEHHAAYLLGTSPPEVTESRAGAVQEFLDREMPFALRLPEALDVGITGARRCRLGDTPVAYLVGRCGEEDVSLMVFPADGLRAFPDAAARFAAEGPIIHCHVAGLRFVGAASNHWIACGVTRGDAAKLQTTVAALVSR